MLAPAVSSNLTSTLSLTSIIIWCTVCDITKLTRNISTEPSKRESIPLKQSQTSNQSIVRLYKRFMSTAYYEWYNNIRDKVRGNFWCYFAPNDNIVIARPVAAMRPVDVPLAANGPETPQQRQAREDQNLRRLEIYFKDYAVYKEDKREWDRLCEIDSKLRERIKETISQQKVALLWLSVLSLRRDLLYVQKYRVQRRENVCVQRFLSDPILALYRQLTMNTEPSAMRSTGETLVAFSPRRESASKFQPRTIDEYLKVKTHPSHTRAGYERREQRITRAMAAHEKGLSIGLSAKRNCVPVLLLQQRMSVNIRRAAKTNPHSRNPPPPRIKCEEEAVIRDWVVE
ncbi:hypothetical protein MMC22_003075 [Lobaria immixta]|nr:hypothetical protein [Lobaria immixta]